MKKYPEYKDSVIKWISNIPKHWEMKKLKFNASIRFSNVDKKTEEGEESVRLCNYVDVYYNDFITLKLEFMAATASVEEIQKFQLNIGDVIVTKDSESWDDVAVPAYVAEAEDKLLCGYHLAQIKPDIKVLNGKFLFWILSGTAFNHQYRVEATGVTRYGLSNYALCNSFIVLPTVEEQTAIASFLDRKTTQIDDLIAKKERIIKLLKEERTAIINQAVTRGLDETVEFKDSGIEWLGEIPKHWEMKKLRYLSKKIGSGVTPKGGALVYQLEGVLFLRSQNIHFDGLRLGDVAYISEDIHEDMSGSKILGGDVLLNITGASIGRCYYYPENLGEANVNQHVCIVRPNRFAVTKYLTYCLSSEVGQQQIINSQNGISREGLNFEELGAFKIPISDLNEQKKIVGYLDKKTEQIDEQVEREKKAIELLKKYRTALISEVVTGKIDVRSET